MDLSRFTPKNRFEDLLLSIAKNTKTLINQAQAKAQETLEYKLNESKRFFNTPSELKGDCFIDLTSWEVFFCFQFI